MSEVRNDYQTARDKAIETLIYLTDKDSGIPYEISLEAAKELLAFSCRGDNDRWYSVKHEAKE